MALQTFRLPDPGEGLVEADIVTWRVAVGNEVKINDILVEVETSKSLVELPSPYAGTVTELLVNEGETVEVGTPIISIDDGVASAAPEAGGSGEDAQVPNLVGYGPRSGTAKRRPRRDAGDGPVEAHDQLADTFSVHAPVSRRADDREPLQPERDAPSGAPLPGPGEAAPAPTPSGGAVLAKPPVRKLAKDLGVDLASLVGSGPGGVITRDDVMQASDRMRAEPFEELRPAPAEVEIPAEPAEARTPREDVRIPIKGIRKSTADAMVRSAFTAPHVSVWMDCDVSATMELVDRLKARRDFADLRISPLLIIAKAVCLALGRTPELNSFWDEQASEIVHKSSVNLGIAAATPRGLLVPNIKGAESLSLAELAGAINRVVATAREGRTQPADMAGGTFTITNIGVFGVDAGAPILNPGESGILCFGQISRRPWVVGNGADERIKPRWVITLSLSFDHRLADGAQGSTFLADVAAILNDPALALLF
ncbi:MAG TPA: dihydrolipoamide acetyltransferase family protein [Propionibacteriaceae bacterium]|nr:dihydrolipoamide acetyltransferase family protein [Propionibacteriaceae bacterium]